MRWFVAFLALGCGDLEADRICASPPCMVPGQASSVCLKYVKCYEAIGGTPGSLDSTYGQFGTCWSTTSAASDACSNACQSALDSFKAGGFGPDAGCTF